MPDTDPGSFPSDRHTQCLRHPGKSGRIFLSKEKDKIVGYFGEIHPNIIKKIDIKTEALVGFELFVDNLKRPKKLLRDQKNVYQVSDFQKSERDFAFIIDKNFKSQKLIEIILLLVIPLNILFHQKFIIFGLIKIILALLIKKKHY